MLDGLAEPAVVVGCWLPVLICDAGLLLVDAVELGADMFGYIGWICVILRMTQCC